MILNQEIPQDLKLPQCSSNSSNSIKNSHFATKLPFQKTPDYSVSIAFSHPRTLQQETTAFDPMPCPRKECMGLR